VPPEGAQSGARGKPGGRCQATLARAVELLPRRSSSRVRCWPSRSDGVVGSGSTCARRRRGHLVSVAACGRCPSRVKSGRPSRAALLLESAADPNRPAEGPSYVYNARRLFVEAARNSLVGWMSFLGRVNCIGDGSAGLRRRWGISYRRGPGRFGRALFVALCRSSALGSRKCTNISGSML